MPNYDAVRFDPPAPIANVELRDNTSGRTCPDVMLLLDTGADVTLLPRECVTRLKVTVNQSETYQLIGFDGSQSTVAAVHLDLLFMGLTFRGRFLVIDQPDGVLGRDVLNHLNISFNGPSLKWEVTR